MELQEIEVLSVEDSGKEIEMIDLEVEENHNFFLSNGFLTHNSVNLLKAATETEDSKVLTKSSYSKEQADLPDKFLSKAKFIFDYNNLYGSSLREDFEALQTRGDVVEMAVCDDEVKRLMRIIAVAPEEKEATEFIINKFDELGTIKLNLRMQQKAFQTRKYAEQNGIDWQEEVEAELRTMSKTRALIYSLIGNRAVRTTELEKILLRNEIFHSVSTVYNKIREWVFTEELFRWSEDERNFTVCINPKPKNNQLF